MCSSLGQAMNYPDRPFVENLLGGVVSADIEECLCSLGLTQAQDTLCGFIEKCRTEEVKQEDLLLDLEKDYTRMCFASKPRLVDLFGSVYQEGKLMQESTFEVARFYYEAGLRLEKDFHLPPDHIAVELEFLAYLAFNEKLGLEQGNKEKVGYARRLHDNFWERHFRPFVDKFTEALAANARTEIYRILAEILGGLRGGFGSPLIFSISGRTGNEEYSAA